MDTDIALTEKQLGEHAGTHQSIGLPARSADLDTQQGQAAPRAALEPPCQRATDE